MHKNRQAKGMEIDGAEQRLYKKGVRVSSNIGLEDVRRPDGGPQSWVAPGGCDGEAVSDGGLVISPQSTGFLWETFPVLMLTPARRLCAPGCPDDGGTTRAWLLPPLLTHPTGACSDICV